MKIEKYKKIKEDLYRIFLDNGEVIDVYEDVIVNNNLLFKKEIDNDLLKTIEKENDYQSSYNMALKYILIRLRSINEIKVYLQKHKISEIIIEDTIERLKKNNLLNDETFAKAFITDKINFTSMGKYKIINELNKLKVDNEIIYNALEEIDEEIWDEKIDKLINKYIKSNKKYQGINLKNKIYVYLVNLGHDKNSVINNLNKHDF